MTNKEVQKLKVGDFLTWVDEDENSIAIGRILSISRYGKNTDKTWWGRIAHATVLVFPIWCDGCQHYSNLANVCSAELEYATFSTQIEIDTWTRAAEEYADEKRKELNLMDRMIHRPTIKSRTLTMEAVRGDYRRNPPKPGCSWNWLWSMAKHVGLWKPSRSKKEMKTI